MTSLKTNLIEYIFIFLHTNQNAWFTWNWKNRESFLYIFCIFCNTDPRWKVSCHIQNKPTFISDSSLTKKTITSIYDNFVFYQLYICLPHLNTFCYKFTAIYDNFWLICTGNQMAGHTCTATLKFMQTGKVILLSKLIQKKNLLWRDKNLNSVTKRQKCMLTISLTCGS